MPTSLSANRPRDTEGWGFDRDALPAVGPDGRAPVELQAFFGFPQAEGASSRPLELEIGSGKGTFLAQQAPLQPDTDFLGIELAKPFWRHAADRARRLGLGNVRLLWHNAEVFVRAHCADGVFKRVHLYFPDPWPKDRHHKRRSFQEPFLREVCRVLSADGELRVATDHEGYFEWMQEHAARVDDVFERCAYEPPASARPGEWVGTNFERKYQKEGRRFQGMVLRKR